MQPDLSKSPRRIAGMFDAIADRYDLLNHLLSAGIDRRWRREAVRRLSLTGTERVLDLCTGTADLALAARAARPPAASVVGIDFSAAMLQVGRAKIVRRASDRMALVRGDATRIPLADRTVDAVTVGFGIRNVQDVEAVCAEMYRVLRPGGRLAILEFGVPTAPGIGVAYRWYFNHVLPRIGGLLSRHNAAYSYLPASVGAFATPEAFAALLGHAGFTEVAARQLSLGIAHLFTARKASHREHT